MEEVKDSRFTETKKLSYVCNYVVVCRQTFISFVTENGVIHIKKTNTTTSKLLMIVLSFTLLLCRLILADSLLSGDVIE